MRFWIDSMKLTIITITFNAERFVGNTIQSIACQSFSDIEYIIVDGKSTDTTMDIVKSSEPLFKARNIKFKWISEPDKGLYDAMTKGIKMATGDFVWFINAGDKIFDGGTAQKVADAIANNSDADVVYGQTLIIDQNDNPCGERHKIAPADLQFRHLLGGLVVCHQSIVVRRSIAPDYDLHYRFSSDYDWTCKVLASSRKNVYVPEYISRFMLAGISAKNRKASLMERFNIMRRHFGLLPTLWAHIVIVLKFPFSKQLK